MYMAYVKICNNKTHPLHKYLHIRKGARLKREKSWMADAGDLLRTVIDTQHVSPDSEWIRCNSLLYQNLTKLHVTLIRECQN